MKFKVIVISKSEQAKVKEDPAYVPQERQVATLEAESETAANRIVGARQSVGIYPPGSQAKPIDETL